MAAPVEGDAGGPGRDIYDQILYDVLIHAEWSKSSDRKLEHRKPKPRVSVGGKLWNAAFRALWTFLRGVGYPLKSPHSCVLPSGLLSITSKLLPWQFSVDTDGHLIAILQETSIEIRSSRDDFVSIVARCFVEEDAHPQWRRLSWNSDASMLAFSDSKGRVKIFDLLGSVLYSIGWEPNPDVHGETNVGTTDTDDDELSRAAAALIFTNRKLQTTRWSGELLVITHQGALTSYYLGVSDGVVHQAHTFLFTWPYAMGLSTAVLVPQFNMLLLGGVTTTNDEGSYPRDSASASVTKIAGEEGLTAWRMISDLPHYKLISDLEEDKERAVKSDSFLAKLSKGFVLKWNRGSSRDKDGIYQLKLSPDNRKVLAVHFSGKLSVWEIPSLRRQSSWSLDQQPGADDIHPVILEKRRKRPRRQILDTDPSPTIDASWWSDAALSLARASGAVSVVAADDLHNLLGDSQEWFEPAPRISPASNKGRLVALEREKKTSRVKERNRASSKIGQTSADDLNRSVDEPDSVELVTDESDDEDLDTSSSSSSSSSLTSRVLSGLHTLLFSAVYFLTDAEFFNLPPSKRQKGLEYETYRLVSLQSTTPEQLFTRRIDNEEYGEALALAHAYGLDSDRVYQRQWRKAVVSSATIHDYLARINNRAWVLRECVDRVPEDVDAQRALLEFGLRATDCKIVVEAGGGVVADFGEEEEEEGPNFSSSMTTDEDEDETLDADALAADSNSVEDQTYRYASERWRRWRQRIIDRIDPRRLTKEQKQLLSTRKRIFEYLDRLSTYECILGGGESAQRNYDHKFFKRFRAENIVKSAVQFARGENLEALDALFTYHGIETLPYRLAILANLPETKSPREYADLLPVLEEPDVGEEEIMDDGADRDCVDWLRQVWRIPDWSETGKFAVRADNKEENEGGDGASEGATSSTASSEDANDGSFLYDFLPEYYRKFETVALTKSLVGEWFAVRAEELEAFAGQVSFAIELVRLGKERGFDLDEIDGELETMKTLVYECRVDPTITLRKVRQMTPLERIKLMMYKSSQEDFDANLVQWLLPFLHRQEKVVEKSYNTLLSDYLTDVSKENLDVAVRVFQLSRPDLALEQPIIRSEECLLAFAMKCIYTCESSDQLASCYSILECLPERRPVKMSNKLKKLHDLVDVLEKHLKVAKILEQYEMNIPVAVVKETEINGEDAFQLVVKLTRVSSRKTPPLTRVQWHKLIADIMTIRLTLYEKTLSIQQCLEILCQSLLCSGREADIALAKDYLTTTEGDAAAAAPGGNNSASKKSSSKISQKLAVADILGTKSKIPFEASVDIVVNSAMEYFNSAATCDDGAMTLAKQCLRLFNEASAASLSAAAAASSPNSSVEKIVKEKRLVDGVTLLASFGIEELPLKIRMCQDRIVYLEQLVVQRPNLATTDSPSFLRLAELLDVNGNDASTREGRVLQVLAEKTLETGQFLACYEYCARLIEARYVPVWSTCHRLAVQPEFRSNLHKKKLLAFALVHCDPDMLEDLLEKRMLVESQVLYQDLSSMMYKEDEDEEEDQKDEEQDFDSTVEDQEFEDTVEDFHQEDLSKEKSRSKSPISGDLSEQQQQQPPPHSSDAASRRDAFKATSAMLSSVTDVGWWTKSLKTLATQIILPKTGRAGYHSAKDSGIRKPAPMEAQGCHPFYESRVANPVVDDTFLDFESLRESAFDSKTELVLEENLLRKSGLEACFTDGASIQCVEDVVLRSSRRWLEVDLQVGMGFLLAQFDGDQTTTQGIEDVFSRLPQTRLTKLVACYFYALLIHQLVAEGEMEKAAENSNDGEKMVESMDVVLKANPHDVILSALNYVVQAASANEPKPWSDIEGVFQSHVDGLVEISKPPVSKGVEGIADEFGDAVVDGVVKTEDSSCSPTEKIVDEMSSAGEILQASAYLLANQPHHRMMTTLSSGLGLLKVFGAKKQ